MYHSGMLSKKQIEALRQTRQYGIGRMLLVARKDFMTRLYAALSAGGNPTPPSAGGALLPFIDLEGIRSVELARRMGVSKQAIGKALKELEDANLVTRIPDDVDGRAFLISFTPQGLAYLLQIHEAIELVERQYAALVGEQGVRTLRKLLGSIAYPDKPSGQVDESDSTTPSETRIRKVRG
jgi:DNA-binding MarR family transcriptional regulator